MMKTSVSVLTLCIAVLVGGWTLAQEDEELRMYLETIDQAKVQGKSIVESLPGDFSDWMAMAMEQNPEIRRTRAAVEMAQADFDEALAELTPNLKSLLARWEIHVISFERAEKAFESLKETDDDKQVFQYAERMKSRLRDLTRTHSEILKLMGGERGGRPNQITVSGILDGFVALAQPRIPQPRPEYKEGTQQRLREILANPVGITFQDVTVVEIFDFIIDTYEINITVDLAFTPPIIRQINLKNVTLRNALLALTDQMGNACFVIRDYGLFLTTRERAQTLAGPTIPDDVPYFALIPAGQFQSGFSGGGFGGGLGGSGGGGGGGGAASTPRSPGN